MMLTDALKSSGAGAVFGAALTLSGVAHPRVIIDQMRFHDFHMLEVFLVAGVSSAVVVLALDRLGIRKREVRTNASLNWFSMYDGNILGGLILGLGMTVSGACPGTVLVQIGQQFPPAKFTAIGTVLGASTYASLAPILKRRVQKRPEKRTIAAQMQLSEQNSFLLVEALFFSVAALSSILLPGKSLAPVPTMVGGLLIGVAQAASILINKRSIGVSTTYEEIGKYIKQAPHQGLKAMPPPSVQFSLGVLIAALFFPQSLKAEKLMSPLQALVGGCFLGFGSRMAGGCTSGHGLSGLASLSFSSLVTTVAIFGGGIISSIVMDMVF